MDLTEGQRKLLAYWGTIQSAVSQRASTADLWGAVRADAEAEGITLTGIRATDMNRLRSIAGTMRNAMDSLMALRPSDAITGRQIAVDISAREPQARLLAPSYIVRFEHDVLIDGQLQTLWRSSVFDGALPATQGDLRSALEGDAQALADDYDVTHVGVGRFQIAAV